MHSPYTYVLVIVSVCPMQILHIHVCMQLEIADAALE